MFKPFAMQIWNLQILSQNGQVAHMTPIFSTIVIGKQCLNEEDMIMLYLEMRDIYVRVT